MSFDKLTLPFEKKIPLKILKCLLAVLFLLSGGSPRVALAWQSKFTLLFTNDHDGQIEPVAESDASKPVGGVTRRMALIEKIRNEVGPKSVLLVDSGDIFTGTALSEATHGELDCAAYELMKYDAVGMGEHDFDYGKKAVLEYRKKYKMPWVSANLVVRLNSQNFVRPYVLKALGVRVGIIGFSNPQTPDLTSRENVAGLFFNPPGAAAKGLHSILKKDADIFIALSRLGVEEDKKFAKDNPFLHVIVGGHSDTVLTEPIVDKNKDGSVAGPLIVQAGSRGLYLGRLDLTVEGHRNVKTKKSEFNITDYHYQLIPVTADLPEDPEMVALVEKYKSKIKTKPLDEVLATQEGRWEDPVGGNSVIGEITADSIRKASGADAALVSGGSLHSWSGTGPLTRGALYEIYPYDDSVVILEVGGAFLKMVLENFKNRAPGSTLDLSGLSFAPTGDNQGREVLINGVPLRDREKYRIAVNDFLAEGGDGYAEFRQLKLRRKTNLRVRDILEAALVAKGKISAQDLEKRW